MRIQFIAAFLALGAGCALAQNNQPARPGTAPNASPPAAQTPSTAPSQPARSEPGNNAVNSPNTNNSAAPVSGANSFTEGQAKSRIESNGFSDVSNLQKDASGVWRGTAKRNGKAVNVSLDFQGNVNSN